MLLVCAMCVVPVTSQAQGVYTPKAAGYLPAGIDSTVVNTAVYDFTALDKSTFVVSVYYTGGASADSLARIEVYHAIDRVAANAGLGRKVSTDATLRYGRAAGATAEYKEESITITGGIGYLFVKLVPTGSPSANFRIKPTISIK